MSAIVRNTSYNHVASMVQEEEKHLSDMKSDGSFIIYKIENSLIVKEDKTGMAATPLNILEYLPNDDCRYVVYNYKYAKNGETKKVQLVLVWSPEGANTGSRMQYSILRTAMLHSLHVEKCPLVSVYDITDLEEDHLAELLR